MSVYVANLSWWTTDEEIEKICSEYGTVQEVTFFEEKANGKSKGVAQVQFAEAKSAMLCRDGLSGKMINNRACVVTFPQQSKPYGYNPNYKYDKRFSQFHEGRGFGRGGGRGRWGGGGGFGMEGDMGMGGGHMGGQGGMGITAGPGNQGGVGGGIATQGMSVYVANLSWWTTDEEIEKICSEYGTVQEVTFFEEKANGKSKGVAQVQFAEAKSAMLCRDGLSGKMINNRACVVTFPQQSKPYGYNPNYKYDKRFSQFHEGRGFGRGGGRGRWGGGGGFGMEGDMGMGGGHMGGMMGGRGGMMEGGGGWGGPANFGMPPFGMGGEQGYGGWRGGRY
eukprot:TRINITY_DN4153_c0_g1_i5.p1 TRINITY_DN4153_c0_g1~~TRINITY_DN4153_c0_g1_i5.p1  ORF type:complete len:370 (-),score=109.62 TRINITY_DN4153_c0_g1_i5:365-1369(-)